MMELMDSKDLIKKFHMFFDEYKKKDIKKAIHEGKSFLPISFFDISEYDIELGDQLLAHPKDILMIMEETLREFYIDEGEEPLKLRLTTLPVTEKVMIRNIRSEHLGKLVLLEGLVRRKTDVRPRLTYLEYLCTNPSCSFSEDKIKIPQLEEKAKTIKTCPKCKSGVELLNKELIDSQNLVLEEIAEQLDNSADQPKRINVLLQNDLVSPFKDSRTNPGSRVYVIGTVREIPILTRTGGDSINYELVVEGNFIDLAEDDYEEIEISKEEEQEIKELAAKDNVVETLVANTAPSIYGHNKIKEAIILQLFGGKGGKKGDGIKTRGDIHILLIGDPGAAKSQLLKSATKVAPKSMFVSGKSASAAGLCVSPKSLLLTNPGGMQDIEKVVEDRFKGKEEKYNGFVWKRDNINDIQIQSMSDNLQLHSQHPQTIWKLKAPEYVYEVELASGKKIELTGNTSLYSIVDGSPDWIKSMDLNAGMYVATYPHWEEEMKKNGLKNLSMKKQEDIDIIPGVGNRLKGILVENKVSLRKTGWHENFSREGLKKFLSKIDIEDTRLEEIRKLADSDITWEKIVKISRKKPDYNYVYDLTVADSHNFVADGVLVHNTASVIKDEMTKGWALEAGALVLANGGLCAIDELDKMSDEDTSAMHEALEQQTISIAKANIRATLKCQTTVLGAANPKFGRFDPYGDIAKQINFPPALISRFDLIFILRDIPDRKRDDMIAGHILQTHKDPKKTKTELSGDFVKKYIAYAKTIQPVLTQEAIDKIKDFYVAIRNASGEEDNDAKSVPITARQLEAILRLAEAYAKIKLDKKVKGEYAQAAIDLLLYCLQKIGIDPKTGELDIDRLTTGVTASTRNEYKLIQQIIDRLETEKPDITFDDIAEQAEKQKIKREDVKKTLDKLKQEGIIFEPRKDVFKKLN